MHEQRDLVELWIMHCTAPTFMVNTIENGSLEENRALASKKRKPAVQLSATHWAVQDVRRSRPKEDGKVHDEHGRVGLLATTVPR